ncbi:XRE family transcriptional regulator [Candidatus Halobeggiatoa sp. HSG11]|nr:XRE family transcriptional regulator [Candidatus Halobeggiatoa sp. HSG11]
MSYILKHFDIKIIKFNLITNNIDGLSVEIIKIYDKNKLPIDLQFNDYDLIKWLKRRVIPKNRAFVQSFLAKLGLNVNDIKGIIDICKGLSLNDCYWIVDENFTGTFAKYNLYENSFSRILSVIAYTGYGNTTRRSFVSTPELTTNGMLAKCWRRINGKIILYKAGSTGAANTGNEPYSEFYAVQIAEAIGLDVVKYGLNRWKGQLCSTCELFTSKQFSYIPIGRIVTNGGWKAIIKYYQELGKNYHDALLDMLIFDVVICNEDRHFGNFGLLVDNYKNQIVDTAPIFDNGLSLFNYAMSDDLQNIDSYANTRLMANSQDFMTFAKAVITKKQKDKLRKLIDFKFKKHSQYNLPAERLKIIERFIQYRIKELLKL